MTRFRLFIIGVVCLLGAKVQAQQITGYVIDAETGDSIPYASVVYKGHNLSTISNGSGRYTISRHEGWNITFSAVGYKTHIVPVNAKTKAKLNVSLKPDKQVLAEVTVKSKRGRYSRKNNPAVELMKRVVDAKKKTDLSVNDYYQYNKYEKITTSLNDLKPEQLETGAFKKHPWLVEQVETSSATGKLILPVSVDETVSQKVYRKEPHAEKTIIQGQSSKGINNIFQTGDIVNTVIKDVFTDIDLYQDHIRLLQYPFISPISKEGIGFYRYYIQDTLFFERSTPELRAAREYNPEDFYMSRDMAIHAIGLDSLAHSRDTLVLKQVGRRMEEAYESVIVLGFTPNNQQDIGFSGLVYVLNDSTYQVKSVELNVPQQSNVNFIENIRIDQYYEDLPGGERVCVQNDMMVEMKVASWLSKLLVQRTVRNFDFQFEEIPSNVFRRIKGTTYTEPDATMHTDDQYWAQFRKVELTQSESQIGGLLKRLTQMRYFKPIMIGMKALIENYIETSDSTVNNKFDFGPINTTVSYNDYDRWRFRLSGFTTAHLHPHIFLSGYIAYGTASDNLYGWGEAVYSFNRKAYLTREFPKNNIHVSYRRDVTTPFDKFVPTDKDNVFMALHTAKVDQYNLIREWKVMYDREWYNGAKAVVRFTRTRQRPVDELFYQRLGTDAAVIANGDIRYLDETNSLLNRVDGITMSEAYASVSFEPGATYINTKQRRVKINKDAPIFTVSHTLGFKDFLGGDYTYNVTEAGIYKRFYLPAGWGYTNFDIRAGIQWDKVPFPLLIHPAVNQSYVLQDFTFSLINSLEFLNDRYAQVMWGWDLCGKVFNRVPLLKKLHWREYIGINALWGTLTDKNNPLAGNYSDSDLFFFPGHFMVDSSGNPYYENNTVVMDKNTPYVELHLGVHNILKLFHVEYVRRLTYLNNPGTHKNGVRFTFRIFF